MTLLAHKTEIRCSIAILLATLGALGCRAREPDTVTEQALTAPVDSSAVHLRVNLLGYLEDDSKVAVAFSHRAVNGEFELVSDTSGDVAFTGSLQPSPAEGWGTFAYYYEADFSAFVAPGRYYLRLADHRSPTFAIGRDAYGKAHEDLLGFMRQQRCGYNPFLDRICHQRDGRSFYGPMPDSTFVDVSGGWHDAGDQLKYLITGSNATARMLLAYELAGDRFGDANNHLGQPGPNGIPDVLDEAKWGLDWLHKMHPGPNQLIHQVADDRDHRGWKMPDEDNSDYGWGPNSYRPAYFATGSPQGLAEYKSEATGMATRPRSSVDRRKTRNRRISLQRLTLRTQLPHQSVLLSQKRQDLITLFRQSRQRGHHESRWGVFRHLLHHTAHMRRHPFPHLRSKASHALALLLWQDPGGDSAANQNPRHKQYPLHGATSSPRERAHTRPFALGQAYSQRLGDHSPGGAKGMPQSGTPGHRSLRALSAKRPERRLLGLSEVRHAHRVIKFWFGVGISDRHTKRHPREVTGLGIALRVPSGAFIPNIREATGVEG